jgi:hypothetical protein
VGVRAFPAQKVSTLRLLNGKPTAQTSDSHFREGQDLLSAGLLKRFTRGEGGRRSFTAKYVLYPH